MDGGGGAHLEASANRPTIRKVPQMSGNETQRRNALIAGLRDMVPVGQIPSASISHYPDGDDETGMVALHAIAELAGSKVEPNGKDTHYHVRRAFGPVEYRATYIIKASRESYRELMKNASCMGCGIYLTNAAIARGERYCSTACETANAVTP
jgi:hypothetical protein